MRFLIKHIKIWKKWYSLSKLENNINQLSESNNTLYIILLNILRYDVNDRYNFEDVKNKLFHFKTYK